MANKGADSLDYYHEPRCKTCTAKDVHGNPIRDKIDAYGTKNSIRDTRDWIKERWGIEVSVKALHNHFKKHAPYVKEAKKYSSSRHKKLRGTIERKITESHEAINRIINVGDQMVKNWAEGREGPKMEVSERMYIEALKEDGRRGTKTVIDAEFEQMDEALFVDDGEGGDD